MQRVIKVVTEDEYTSSSSAEDFVSKHRFNNGDNSVHISIESTAKIKNDGQVNVYKLSILGLNFSNQSAYFQFFICSACVFVFYLIYGYCQELIFTVEGFKPYGWFLTMTQFLLYSFFGLIEMFLKHDRTRKMPLKNYLLLAFLTVGTMGFSNSSLGYLNYPTQVIFKCCKLIPVLVGGIIIQGKSFNKFDWLACFCMSLGLIFFTLADSMVAPSFNIYGVFLISVALMFDAAIGNLQEKFMKSSLASNAEVVFYSYAVGFLYILLGQIVSKQLPEAFDFCQQNPKIYIYTFLFSFSGYLGVNVVLSLVQLYGALIAVTVTTFRKALTIILSFLLFSKPFTMQYVWSGMIVLIGIYLNVYSKNQKSWDNKLNKIYKNLLPSKQPRLMSLDNLKSNIV
ncbi:hypothetical protein HELRODRAFT_79631 [Helobdella robusta]|uniref:Adenosine 3'-phospho 5'-phosphosulfate transporter 2 n=1 Tax=Helobdella robusta TaxID=6412 RepID=T1G3R6_HELRO|nr:hypothetical protein HELRODRAFT_79631 [Helobdella robusta]ESO03954.1 hypothetical protein HELRODRAFT_79631 [Helobdella robusta]